MSGISGSNCFTNNVFVFPNMSVYIPWKYGMLQNSYTFVSKNNEYIPNNQFVTANFAFANYYFGANQPIYKDSALFDPGHKNASFILREEKNGIGTGYTIEITNGSYIGRFDKSNKYQIMSITNDTMILRNLNCDSP